MMCHPIHKKMWAETLIFPILLATIPLCYAVEWDYGDTNWTTEYPSCGGSNQSPINIDTDTTMSADYSDFMFSIGYKVAQVGTLENNGHTCGHSIIPCMPTLPRHRPDRENLRLQRRVAKLYFE